MSEQALTDKTQTPLDEATDVAAPISKKHDETANHEISKGTASEEKDAKKKKKKSTKPKKPKKRKKSKSRYRDFLKAAMAPKKRPKKVFTLPAAVHFKKIDRI